MSRLGRHCVALLLRMVHMSWFEVLAWPYKALQFPKNSCNVIRIAIVVMVIVIKSSNSKNNSNDNRDVLKNAEVSVSWLLRLAV